MWKLAILTPCIISFYHVLSIIWLQRTQKGNNKLLPQQSQNNVFIVSVTGSSLFKHLVTVSIVYKKEWYAKQKHLRYKKVQGKEELATKSYDINQGQEVFEQVNDLKLWYQEV